VYVDHAKDQLEKLISFDDNELDIPQEYLQVYRQKFQERELLKDSLRGIDPTVAKSKLSQKYEEYHDYFENTYTSMLILLRTFKYGNDIDSSGYFMQMGNLMGKLDAISIDSTTKKIDM